MTIKNAKVLAFVLLLVGCVRMGGVAESIEQEKMDPRVTPVEKREFVEMTVADEKLNVELVDTGERITLGLSYRDEIGADGMMFDLGNRSVPSFWMKGMKFGLDFLWIDCGEEGPSTVLNQADSSSAQDDSTDLNSLSVESKARECEVVDVTERVPSPSNPNLTGGLPTYSPRSPVTHVLELPEGVVDERGFEIGDVVEMSLVVDDDTIQGYSM